MKYTQEEILNALKIIKETCSEQDECKHCPFCGTFRDSRDFCVICDHTPSAWELNDATGEWRAFV